jgi:lysyl-tRNA synthetase class 2
MLEWARAYSDLRTIEHDVESLITKAWQRLCEFTGASELSYLSQNLTLDRPWPRITVREALQRHLGVEVTEDFSTASVRQAATQVGVPFTDAEDPGLLLSGLLDRLQQHLGFDVPTFLQEWPATMTTSARLVPDKPALAERSELYIAGLEIADGFPFLDDPALQERLFRAANEERRSQGLPIVGVDERYVCALGEGIPPGAGMALGIDRLVMALTGEHDIHRVQPFGWEER